MTVAAGMVFFGFTLVMPFLPFYVASLGVDDRREVALWSGFLMTVSPFLAAILGPLWGRLADRVGLRLMVQRVLFTIALHWGLMFLAGSLWHVLALRIMLGLFSGFGTMSIALVTQGCPRERIGRAVGLLQATQILSTALGPFVGGILAEWIGIRKAFLVTCVLCTLALLFVRLLYRNVPAEQEEDRSVDPIVLAPGPVAEGARAVVPGRTSVPAASGRPSFRDLLGLPLFLPLLPLLFFINLVDRSLFLSVPLLITGILPPGSRAEGVVGMVISAGALASAASAYLFGHRAARTSPATLLVWSLAGSAATLAPIAFCRTILPLGVLRVLVGAALGGAATLAYTLGGAFIPARVRATAYAILSSVALLGGAFGPILAGLLSTRDPRVPFLAGAALCVGLSLLAASLARREWVSPAPGVT
ncbi:MAG: MFS transporter, partial [Candidatus Polarisedimenticolia bacterium]